MDTLFATDPAGIAGLIALALFMARFAVAEKIHFMRINTAASFALAAHFFLIDAMTGFALTFVAAIRTHLLTTQWGWDRRNKVGWGALAAAALLNIALYADPVMMVMLAAPATLILAEIRTSMLFLRLMHLLNHCIWLGYGLAVGSMTCVVLEFANLASNLPSLYYYHIRPALRQRTAMAGDLPGPRADRV